MKFIIFKGLKVFFKFSFTFLILFWLIYHGNLDLKKLGFFLTEPLIFLSLCALIVFGIIPVTSFRWWLFLTGQQIFIRYKDALKLTWVGFAFNFALPGAVSGDLVKGYYLHKHYSGISRSITLTTLLIDRIVGLFGLILISLLAILYRFITFPESKTNLFLVETLILLLGLSSLIFYLIVLAPFQKDKDPFKIFLSKFPFHKYFVKIYLGFKEYQDKKMILISTLCLSVFNQALAFICLFKISEIIFDPVPNFVEQILVAAIGMISTAIPISPGGIGIGHAAFKAVYELLGVREGADLFNLYVVLQFSIYIWGFVPYLFMREKGKAFSQ